MARNILVIILRVLSIGLLVFLIVQLGLIYDTEIFNMFNILSIVGDLRDVFAYLLYLALFGIFTGIFYGLGPLFASLGIIDINYFFSLVNNIFTYLVGRWFYFPNLTDTAGNPIIAPTIDQAWTGLRDRVLLMTEDIYLVGLQVLVVLMFFFALRASITTNPADSIKVVTILNVLIIIPLFIRQIYNVLTVNIGLLPSIEYYPEFFQNMYNHELLQPDIFVDIRDLSFGGFLVSKIFIVAVIVFVYLEFVFQLAYVQKVTTPSVEREQRLSRQIDLMHEEAKKAIERIKLMEEKKREQKRKEREERLQMSAEEREKLKEKEERLSLASLMSEKAETTGFSYVADLIKKKKEEKKEQKLMDAMRDTRKVANYLDKLFKQDPEARDQLTARTAAPKATQLVRSTIVNMLSRIVIIAVLAWACVHPYDIFNTVFRAPPSIGNSVELITYEAVLSLLIPFLLIIPLISNIIKITKYNKLNEILRQEEIRRLGITEEEYEEMQREKERLKEEEEEVKMARDKDAIADRAKKAKQMAQYQ